MTAPEIAPQPPGATAQPAHPLPTRPLSRHALTQWTLEGVGWALLAVIAAMSARAAIDSWDGPALLRDAIVPLAIAGALAGVLVVPRLRWRRWRYEVRDEEVDLRHGALTVVRTIVPMARVQHVETRRTFLSQVFQTATVVIHTAAGSVEIPLLDEPVAAELRDRIAELARTPDDDDRV